MCLFDPPVGAEVEVREAGELTDVASDGEVDPPA